MPNGESLYPHQGGYKNILNIFKNNKLLNKNIYQLKIQISEMKIEIMLGYLTEYPKEMSQKSPITR